MAGTLRDLYRKKAERDAVRKTDQEIRNNFEAALSGKAVEGFRFEVFAVTDGIFSRKPLCADDPHPTLFDACRCAGITSLRDGLNNYGKDVEIVMLEDDRDFFSGEGIRVVTSDEIRSALSRTLDARQAEKLYLCLATDESCETPHESLMEAATCANFYDSEKGYLPCAECFEQDNLLAYTDSPCYRHERSSGVFEQDGRALSPQEVELGIKIEELADRFSQLDKEPERRVYSQDDEEDYGDMPFDL